MECGAGTAAAAPGRGHRPGTALGAIGAVQVTFRRRRPLSGRSRVPAQAAGGTCNLGSPGPGPSDTPPPRPGLPGRRALTCTASRSTRGLLGLGCADRTALGLRSEFRARRGRRSREGGGGSGGLGGGGGGGLRRSALGRPTLLPAALQQPPQITSGARASGAGRQPALPVRGADYSMATANKGSPDAGEAQWYSLPVDPRRAPGFARRSHLPSPGRGSRVAVFSSSQDMEGLLEKEGEGEAAILLLVAARFSGKSFPACSLQRGLSQIKS